ncbi:MAG: DoxX family protein [Xanthobacteraceae bacterium]
MAGTNPTMTACLPGGTMDRNFLILIARVCLSAVYLYSGVDKLVFWNDGLKFCVEHKMPRPNVVLAVTAIIHLVCGLMVLLGFFAREGAVVLLLFTIIATYWVHNPIGRTGDDFRRETTISLEHLAIIGGLLLIAVTGPGAFALRP